LLINAPSGVGKNYVIKKVSSLFPKSDILLLAGMTEKALFHRSGTLVIKNVNGEYQSIEPQLEDLQNQIHENESELSKATDDRSKRQEVKNSIELLKEKKQNYLKIQKNLLIFQIKL
jgi:hypothetical protein